MPLARDERRRDVSSAVEEGKAFMEAIRTTDICDQAERLYEPRLVLIGAAGRNSGKTLLACDVIAAYAKEYPVYALKIIGIERAGEECHRGGAGCGMCTNLSGNYELREETGENGGKDTARMLQAGAHRAFLLRSLKSSMYEAFWDFVKRVPQNALIVCESNSLRLSVRPGVFLFAGAAGEMKPSARAVAGYADYLLPAGEHAAARLIRVQQGADGSLWARPADKGRATEYTHFHIKVMQSKRSNVIQGVNNGNV